MDTHAEQRKYKSMSAKVNTHTHVLDGEIMLTKLN